MKGEERPSKPIGGANHRQTFAVPEQLFRAVYDTPASLPGKSSWVTSDEDVRRLEEILGIPPESIGAPLWVSGDQMGCPNCGRVINWLDIVASALGRVHEPDLITRVILGEQRFVNAEVPDAIAGVRCFACDSPIESIRSFKCHNWAYAHGDIEQLLKGLGRPT